MVFDDKYPGYLLIVVAHSYILVHVCQGKQKMIAWLALTALGWGSMRQEEVFV
jgi:hypothetical protein